MFIGRPPKTRFAKKSVAIAAAGGIAMVVVTFIGWIIEWLIDSTGLVQLPIAGGAIGWAIGMLVGVLTSIYVWRLYDANIAFDLINQARSNAGLSPQREPPTYMPDQSG